MYVSWRNQVHFVKLKTDITDWYFLLTMETFFYIFLIPVWLIFINVKLIQSEEDCSFSPYLSYSTRIETGLFHTVVDSTVAQCCKDCMLRSDCQSLNFKTSSRTCYLSRNSSTLGGQLSADLGYLYSEISSWPKVG